MRGWGFVSRTIAPLCFLGISLAYPVLARERTDVIVMKNGDRITGEVKTMIKGVLTVELDYTDGALSINWLKVARIESGHLFLVQLDNGEVYSAKLVTFETPAGRPVKVELAPEDKAPMSVEQTAITRVTQTSESLLSRFSGAARLGASYSRGNSSTQYNLGLELDYLEPNWGSTLDYESNLQSNSGSSTSTRNQTDLAAYHLMRWRQYFYSGAANFLQSDVQGIKRQIDLGIGVGRYLKNTPRVRWTVRAGPAWKKTNYSEDVQITHTSQNVAVAFFSTDLHIFTFKRTNLDLTATAAPAFTERGRVFSKINTTYYLKLFGKIDWDLSFYGNWDSRPPEHLSGADYGSTTGLSWNFGNK